MSSKPPFFFDEDPVPHMTEMSCPTEGTNLFFDALKEAGIIQDTVLEKELAIKPDASYQEMKTHLVAVEYGVFKKDYSIHITPLHAKWNLDTQQKVDLALVAAIKAIVPAIAPSFRVDVYQPRKDWELKVISIVIRNAAEAWNFNREEFEQSVIPGLIPTLEGIIKQ